jgi:hypothetical protein
MASCPYSLLKRRILETLPPSECAYPWSVTVLTRLVLLPLPRLQP